jgi:uncharacterized protein YegJ (DUF2314 family)
MTIASTLRRTAPLALAASLACAAATGPAGAQTARAQVIDRPADDPEIDAAIAKARASLPKFWASLDKPKDNERGFALKVGLTTADGGREHIWIADIKRDGSDISGVIGNAPVNVPMLKEGAKVVFGATEVSDWMFMRGNKIVGNETMRPLIAKMSAAEAAKYRIMLETP